MRSSARAFSGVKGLNGNSYNVEPVVKISNGCYLGRKVNKIVIILAKLKLKLTLYNMSSKCVTLYKC